MRDLTRRRATSSSPLPRKSASSFSAGTRTKPAPLDASTSVSPGAATESAPFVEVWSWLTQGLTSRAEYDILGFVHVLAEFAALTAAEGLPVAALRLAGATAALLVTIAGYGEPLSEGQWRELAGVVGGIMRDSTYADLARLRTLITQEQFLNVARNQGYIRFIRRLDDGRWVCELAPKLEDLPDE